MAPYISYWLLFLIFICGYTTPSHYIHTGIFFTGCNSHHLNILCWILRLLFLHFSNQEKTILYDMIKLSKITAGLSCWIQTVARIMASISTIIENDLSSSSASWSTSSASSSALESSAPRRGCWWYRINMNSIDIWFIQHHVICTKILFMMP